MDFILASGSERRKELLERIVKEFEIRVSDFNEDSIIFEGSLNSYVERLAMEKGMAIDIAQGDYVVISADTIVSYNNAILGKPKNKEDAFRILKMLSGNVHEVYTGVSVYNSKTKIRLTRSFVTKVKFSELTDLEIKEYIETGEPLDKAGAYGIQGLGGIFVEEITGCYYNVVGLPLNATKKLIKAIIK